METTRITYCTGTQSLSGTITAESGASVNLTLPTPGTLYSLGHEHLIVATTNSVSRSQSYVSPRGNDWDTGRSWAHALKSIQAGIDASPGSPVWVAAGTYENDIIVGAGSQLYGGFAGYQTSSAQRNWVANPTIIEASDSVDSLSVVPGASPTTVDGFAIQAAPSCHGITRELSNTSSAVTIANCTITGSQSYGIYCDGYGSRATLQATITNNFLLGSFYYGIECYGYQATIADNVITQAATCGVMCDESGGTNVVNNTLIGNGSAFQIAGGSATVTNNIVAFNQSGVVYESGQLALDNNCVYGNTTANYVGVSSGARDVNANPLIVGSGNYRPQQSSPCIDAGLNTPLAGSLDVYDQPRVQAASIDIGAAEHADITLPTTPVVIDDGLWQSPPITLRAAWSSTDSGSDIAEYQYAVGTSATDPGTGYLVGWTNAGTNTSVTRSDLSVSTGHTYYFYVKAEDAAGNWSSVGVGNPITIEPLDLLANYGAFDTVGYFTNWFSFFYDQAAFNALPGLLGELQSDGYSWGAVFASANDTVCTGWSRGSGPSINPAQLIYYPVTSPTTAQYLGVSGLKGVWGGTGWISCRRG